MGVVERIEAVPAPPVYLHPGQFVVTKEPVVITTILGSCVAVCLWDAKAGVAGINHFLLPKDPQPRSADPRYGDSAMDALIFAMWKRGAAIDRLVAKVFGGACVLAGAGAGRSIGAQNAELARRVLERHSIAVAIDRTGGQRGRKLLFDAGDGTAWVKEL